MEDRIDVVASIGKWPSRLWVVAMVIVPCAASLGQYNVNVPLNGNINAAIDQVNAAGGGTVALAAGNWTISSSINMLSNVTLMGVLVDDTVTQNTVDFNNNTMDGGYGIRIWTGTGTLSENVAEGNAVASYAVSAGWTQEDNVTLEPEPACVGIFQLVLPLILRMRRPPLR